MGRAMSLASDMGPLGILTIPEIKAQAVSPWTNTTLQGWRSGADPTMTVAVVGNGDCLEWCFAAPGPVRHQEKPSEEITHVPLSG